MDEATYVYCLIKADEKPKLGKGKAPNGLADTGKPRLVDLADDFYALVGSAPLDTYDAKAIDPRLKDIDWVSARAGEHDEVVEFAMKLGTVIPMKLFTLFEGDKRAVDQLSKMKGKLGQVVDRIAGCEEWSLRIIYDEQRVAEEAAKAAASVKVKSGRDFLLRKKALDDGRKTKGQKGAAMIDVLYKSLERLAKRAQRRPPARELQGVVMLDAVFLIEKSSVKKVKDAVGEIAEELVAEGFNLSLSGPWPPYSFV